MLDVSKVILLLTFFFELGTGLWLFVFALFRFPTTQGLYTLIVSPPSSAAPSPIVAKSTFVPSHARSHSSPAALHTGHRDSPRQYSSPHPQSPLRVPRRHKKVKGTEKDDFNILDGRSARVQVLIIGVVNIVVAVFIYFKVCHTTVTK